MAVSTPTLSEVRCELMQLSVQEYSLLTLPELRSELTQLLVQEDRLLFEYKRVHEDFHFRQRKARTGDEFQDHLMGLKESLVRARMKVLGMDIRDVAERRRELLKQILKLEKADVAAKSNRTASKVAKNMSDGPSVS